jgi:thiol-disulfide isomerase/thioredoxin
MTRLILSIRSAALLACATALQTDPQVARAQEPAPKPTAAPIASELSPADKAFAEIRTVSGAPYTIMNDRERWQNLSREERGLLTQSAAALVAPLGEKFLADYPNDPRRWQVVGLFLNLGRTFSGDDAEKKKTAWDKRLQELRDQLVNAPDADDNTVASVLELSIYDALGGLRNPDAKSVDLAKASDLVAAFERRVPSSDRRRFAERRFVNALAKADPVAAEAHLRRRIAEKSINPALAAQSEGMLRIITARREPLELAFTSLDGCNVDLADYRGKVVLIDFWATWCVPCMEEMPNVKRVYAAYHNKGFEVIGISLDAAPRDPSKPRKHEKSAEQVKAFLVQENMTWPQHYDGKWWDNEYSRRFALGSIPATFLLGKDGRLYATENHGDHLEANVKTLLGL